MAQFATTDELADFLGRPIDPDQEGRAQLMIRLASGVIQREARQTIERVTDHEVELRGSWGPELFLPERPVVAIASIQVGSDPELVADDYEWERGGLVKLIRRSPWG